MVYECCPLPPPRALSHMQKPPIFFGFKVLLLWTPSFLHATEVEDPPINVCPPSPHHWPEMFLGKAWCHSCPWCIEILMPAGPLPPFTHTLSVVGGSVPLGAAFSRTFWGSTGPKLLGDFLCVPPPLLIDTLLSPLLPPLSPGVPPYSLSRCLWLLISDK